MTLQIEVICISTGLNVHRDNGMAQLIKLIIHVFFPLAAGSFIYIYLRCNNVFFVEIIESICCLSQNKYACEKEIVWDWIIFNLPDGLWVYSLTSLMIIIWKNDNWESLIWICSGLLIAIISELCQAIGVLPGTYDPIDIIFGSRLAELIISDDLP